MSTYPLSRNKRLYKPLFPTSPFLVDIRNGYGQKPITDKPLAYTCTYGFTEQFVKPRYGYPDIYLTPASGGDSAWSNGLCWSICNLGSSVGKPERAAVVNKAYAKLVAELGAQADMGTFLVEGREAVSTIVTRANQLTDAYKHLRKGNLAKAFRSLGVRRPPTKTKWTRPKDASAIWLEYWMHWAPLVGDVFSATQVLVKDPPPVKISGSGATSYQGVIKSTSSSSREFWFYSGQAFCKQGCKVKVSNPNTYLAAQLGLLNPAGTLWNVIPFSFIADWFGSVGDVLSSIDDFYGMSVLDAYTTLYSRCSSSCDRSRNTGPNGSWETLDWSKNYQFAVTRSMGLTTPILTFTFPSRLSLTRALTSISLLVSIFTKG